jgi:predicted GIY-YIG superfamily endonuclease
MISTKLVRESEVKQMARRTKFGSIESTNPDWRDLSAE